MEIEKLLELIENGKCLILTGARQPTRFFYKMSAGTYHIDTFIGVGILRIISSSRPCKTYNLEDFLIEIENLRETIKNGNIEIEE